MIGIPDLIGLELQEGLDCLKKNGLAFQLIENYFPGKEYPPELKNRIVRVRQIETGELELTYSVDTYSTGEEV